MSDLQASLSWEIDFWGKQRAAYQSALGLARATALDAQAAQLALSTGIAHAYIQLQREYLLLDVAQATVSQRERIIGLTRDRNQAGLDSLLEVRQTEEAVPAAREQVIQLQENIELTRDQLAALLGAGPDRGAAITRPDTTLITDPALPSYLPSNLLGRRPDLIAQRLRVAAATETIKERKAQFYPNVDLIAFAGFQRLGPGALISAGERQAGVGPALDLPLFDAGRRRAQLAGSDAAYDMAVEQYNQALSNALREVADQLSSMRSVAAQHVQQQLALEAASAAYDLAVLRYREGVGNYLQVLTTEDQLLVQQRLAAELKARRLDLAVTLIGALGGGFEESTEVLAHSR
jgi:NodT family efflux transporter outer membrane factor (OMF) lipoprotein